VIDAVTGNFTLALCHEKYDNKGMDIQSASVSMNQARLQEQAAVQVQAMGLDAAKEQAVALEKLLASAEIITDPNLGRNLNIIA
jgi:hypothetical protein